MTAQDSWGQKPGLLTASPQALGPTPTSPECPPPTFLQARGPAGPPVLQGPAVPGSACDRQRPGAGGSLHPTSPPPAPTLAPGEEAQGRQGLGFATIPHVRQNVPSPHPTPGAGRKGESTRCPNIWTSQRAKTHHPDVCNARCWCPRRAHIWVVVAAYVGDERCI